MENTLLITVSITNRHNRPSRPMRNIAKRNQKKNVMKPRRSGSMTSAETPIHTEVLSRHKR